MAATEKKIFESGAFGRRKFWKQIKISAVSLALVLVPQRRIRPPLTPGCCTGAVESVSYETFYQYCFRKEPTASTRTILA
jgi:hypothetical protein